MIILNENDVVFKCVKCNQTFVLRPTDNYPMLNFGGYYTISVCPKCYNLVFVEERDVR